MHREPVTLTGEQQTVIRGAAAFHSAVLARPFPCQRSRSTSRPSNEVRVRLPADPKEVQNKAPRSLSRAAISGGIYASDPSQWL